MPDRPSESQLESVAKAALREAGYSLVMAEVRADKRRFDVVGYSTDEQGRLRADAVVEIRRSHTPKETQHILEQLAVARELLGTRKHYVFTGADWFAADAGLLKLEPIDHPDAVESHPTATVNDFSMAEQLLSAALWREAEKHRGERAIEQTLNAFIDSLAHGAPLNVGDDAVIIDTNVLWDIARELTVKTLLRDVRRGEFLSTQAASLALARIVGTSGNRYLDPFCGSGSLLWNVVENLRAEGRRAGIAGIEINAEVFAGAHAIAQLSPMPVELTLGNAFEVGQLRADRIVTQPPFGVRLPTPHQLNSGDRTIHADLAAMDLCINALQAGGRAVMQVPVGWTFLGGAHERFRRHLAETCHVAAIISLPRGAVAAASLASTIAVVVAEQPGDTLVAHLEEDWQEELGPNGALYRELAAHLASTEAP